MKKVLVTLIGLLATMSTSAQELKAVRIVSIVGEKMEGSSLRKDLNGDPCALIKVEMPDEIEKVEGNFIGDVINKGSEKWVYLTGRTKEFRIFSKKHVPLMVTFKDIGIPQVHGGVVYKLQIADAATYTPVQLDKPIKPVESINIKGVDFKMIRVDGGIYHVKDMGRRKSDGSIETVKAHDIEIKPFYICETETTQKMWNAVWNTNPSKVVGDDYPVEYVALVQCKRFIKLLNFRTGLKFRLPSLNEWRFAASGGNLTEGHLFAGSDDFDSVAWFNGNSKGTTHPVKQKKPNELGLYDMNGNVAEWTQEVVTDADVYKLYSFDPNTPIYCICGGSMNCSEADNSILATKAADDQARSDELGFRLVLDIDD